MFVFDALKRLLCVYCEEKLRRVGMYLDTIIASLPSGVKRRAPSGDVVEEARFLEEWLVPPFVPHVRRVDANAVYEKIREVAPQAHIWMLDGQYWVTDERSFRRMVEWDWTDAKRYELDRFDCDDFAMYFKARMAFEFGVNGIGYVIDYDAGHAYNLVVLDNGGELVVKLFEPQTDTLFDVDARDRRLYVLGSGTKVVI